jgi:hypothetical protein
MYLNSTDIGVILVNIKIIRFFDKLSLYIYVHDSFLDLLFFNLKKNVRFMLIKKSLSRKFYKKYRRAVRLYKQPKVKLFRLLKRKILLKYSRKLFFLFIKNKILKIY